MTPNQFYFRVLDARDKLPHGQRPTDAHVRIADQMRRWQNNSPSHTKLARACNVCRETVGNAMKRFRELGLLTWEPRFIRLIGGFMARASNRYFFPEQSSLPAAKPKPYRALLALRKNIKKGIFTCSANFPQGSDTPMKPGISEAEFAAFRQARVAKVLANPSAYRMARPV
jgi:DNA-binding transcriptional MocR family regulator